MVSGSRTLTVISTVGFASWLSAQEAPTQEKLNFFEKKIRPVLVEKCYACHSSKSAKAKGGLSLDTRQGIRQGGDSGPAVVPNDVNESLLLTAIRHTDENLKMPPKSKLSDEVIADFENWVKMGAPDPRDSAAASSKSARTQIDIEKGRQFWAFQPPKSAPRPDVKNATWPRTDIDRFILAGLEAKNLHTVPDADPQALVRRIYFDLTGLPPTPADVDEFVAACGMSSHGKTAASGSRNAPAELSTAVSKLVDKLLDTPQFGERWGRHWLDVVRFGESSGKQANFLYPNAWRYRDYVVASFNADKPYDRFLQEQIAGDLLPAGDSNQKAELIVATGFLAIGPKSHSERNRLQFQLDLVDEQIDATSQAFLGMTIACARCHDHKFDPIPTRDYYALAGIFRSTDTCYGTTLMIQNRHPSPLVPLPADANVPAGRPPLTSEARQRMQRQLERLEEERKSTSKSDMFGTPKGIRNRTQTQKLQNDLASYEEDGTPKNRAMAVRDRLFPKDSEVFVRGEVDKLGEIAPRGLPQVLCATQPQIKSGSGRRELAAWLASKDNPLTARVFVNRVWLKLFGSGIVPTPDNFGASGQPPSNQALLDNLAVKFMSAGWSTKKLIREIMLSRVYQLSSSFDARNVEVDPENVLVWRMNPRRLDAEEIRDALLWISGNLDLTPPEGSQVARFGEGNAGPAARFFFGDGVESHRSIYLSILRDQLPESLALFDFAEPSLVTGERPTTTVPAQALFLMNNPFVIRMAEQVADRARRAGATDAQRIRRAYTLTFSRQPSDSEIAAAQKFLSEFEAKSPRFLSNRVKNAWTAFCQALIASGEFLYLR